MALITYFDRQTLIVKRACSSAEGLERRKCVIYHVIARILALTQSGHETVLPTGLDVQVLRYPKKQLFLRLQL